MNNEPSIKKRCPACNADCTGKTTCHRCGADLKPLIRLMEQTERMHTRAISAWLTRDYDTMFRYARRAAAIRFSPETVRVLFCAAVLVRRFDLALSVRDKAIFLPDQR